MTEELVREVDSIFHLAASVGVRLVIERPTEVLINNILGTEIVLKFACRYRKRVLVASTSEVYGKSDKKTFHEDDDRIMGPTSRSRWGYATSKAVDEFLALAYHEGYWRSNLNLAILDSEEGQQLDAIRRLERVAEISPGALGTAEANYRIGEIYVGVGKLDRAVHHFAAAASQRPSGTWGKRSEVYLERLR